MTHSTNMHVADPSQFVHDISSFGTANRQAIDLHLSQRLERLRISHVVVPQESPRAMRDAAPVRMAAPLRREFWFSAAMAWLPISRQHSTSVNSNS